MNDLNVFAAWVAILAFLLAIPMAVIANILTPKASGWWAITSSRRREKRITALRMRLDQLKAALEAESRQQQLVNGLRYFTYAALVAIYFFMIPIALMLAPLADKRGLTQFLNWPGIKLSPETALYILFVLPPLVAAAIWMFLRLAAISFMYASREYLESQSIRVHKELERLGG